MRLCKTTELGEACKAMLSIAAGETPEQLLDIQLGKEPEPKEGERAKRRYIPVGVVGVAKELVGKVDAVKDMVQMSQRPDMPKLSAAFQQAFPGQAPEQVLKSLEAVKAYLQNIYETW